MPSRIRWFVWVTLINLVIVWAWVAIYRYDFEVMEIIRSPITSPPQKPGEIITTAYIAMALSSAMHLVPTFFIAFRQGWARWVLLAWTLFEDVPSVPGLFQHCQRIPFERLIESLGIVLDVIAIYLIFSAPARVWFRKSKPQS